MLLQSFKADIFTLLLWHVCIAFSSAKYTEVSMTHVISHLLSRTWRLNDFAVFVDFLVASEF